MTLKPGTSSTSVPSGSSPLFGLFFILKLWSPPPPPHTHTPQKHFSAYNSNFDKPLQCRPLFNKVNEVSRKLHTQRRRTDKKTAVHKIVTLMLVPPHLAEGEAEKYKYCLCINAKIRHKLITGVQCIKNVNNNRLLIHKI